MQMPAIKYLAFSLSLAIVMRASADEAINHAFAESYRQAKTANEKRAACLAAIDTGAIAVGVNIDLVRKTCGSDFDSVKAFPDGSGYGFVNFEAPIAPSQRDPGEYRGWYLLIEYQAGGSILYFHLTNLHKYIRLKSAP